VTFNPRMNQTTSRHEKEMRAQAIVRTSERKTKQREEKENEGCLSQQDWTRRTKRKRMDGVEQKEVCKHTRVQAGHEVRWCVRAKLQWRECASVCG
jgi:hypothetical protein